MTPPRDVQITLGASAGRGSMNRFDREFWDGARESALAIYTAVEGRQDVPSDVRQLVRRVLIEAGERKNRDFREALGLRP